MRHGHNNKPRLYAVSARERWETAYRTKGASGVSWYQPEAAISLALIQRVVPDRKAPLIDVGGGASTLVDGLLNAGYRRVTVLDWAALSLAIAQQRLGERAGEATWVDADVLTATFPRSSYRLWHDRAVFHFLTNADDRATYVAQVRHAVPPEAFIVIASFGSDGPTRCSGLPVVRYSPETMQAEFGNGFRLIESLCEDHHTPGGATQPFLPISGRVT